MSVKNRLESAAKIFSQREKVYGNSWKMAGRWIFALLSSKGILADVRNEKDMSRLAILFHIFAKLDRYCTNFGKGGHEDSLHDISVYAAMLAELDNEQRKEKGK